MTVAERRELEAFDGWLKDGEARDALAFAGVSACVVPGAQTAAFLEDLVALRREMAAEALAKAVDAAKGKATRKAKKRAVAPVEGPETRWSVRAYDDLLDAAYSPWEEGLGQSLPHQFAGANLPEEIPESACLVIWRRPGVAAAQDFCTFTALYPVPAGEAGEEAVRTVMDAPQSGQA